MYTILRVQKYYILMINQRVLEKNPFFIPTFAHKNNILCRKMGGMTSKEVSALT